MRVLLVEDDPMIGEAVAGALKDAALAVDWVRDGDAALAAIRAQTYDTVLLDLGLPRRDGLEVLRTLRQSGNDVPVIIVTARDAIADRLSGLDGGADDYVPKPFDMAEVMARIRAVGRRRGGSARPLLGNGTITLDPVTRELSVAGRSVRLSAREFALMQALLVRPGAILSRSELEDRLYGWGEEVASNAVEFLIHSVRRKAGPAVIVNVRGVGWMVPKHPEG